MKKEIVYFFTALIVVCLSSSCSDNDKDNSSSNSLLGWYIRPSDMISELNFSEINKAINNNEVLSSYHYGGQTHNHVASYSLFISSSGLYSDSSADFGRLRFSIPSCINVTRIVDNNTLCFYIAWLYIDGSRSEEAVYKLYAGPIFGNMTYYASPSYYTYERLDNKIIVSNGDIYTIVDGTLIKDGSSEKWNKYDPSKRY